MRDCTAREIEQIVQSETTKGVPVYPEDLSAILQQLLLPAEVQVDAAPVVSEGVVGEPDRLPREETRSERA